MKNFKKVFSMFLIVGFLVAIPSGFSYFQATDNNASLMNNNQSVDDVVGSSSPLPDYLGLVNHLTNERQLVKAPTSHLTGFTKAPATSGSLEIIIGLDGNSLLAEQAKRADSGLTPLSSAQQKSYVSSLRSVQSQYVASLENLGARVIYTYQVVFNGIAVVVDSQNLQTIDQMSGISTISESTRYAPALDSSVPFIFGGKTNAELGVDGAGTTIAIIDTGIDYTHADFGGSGNPSDYATNDPTVVESGTFPTAKVVGGYDFVGTNYDAGCPAVTPAPGVCSSIPVPDSDPLDEYGHGTHVAGIAAGFGTSTVSQGVAPAASLLALKVFGAEGSVADFVIIRAIEMAVDPNGDGDTSDHADVINMSLGSPYGTATNSETTAINAAVDAGVIVVASAGNEGDLPYVTGSPATADKAISVAAGTDPGVGYQLVNVAGSNGVDGDLPSLEAAITPTLASTGTVSGLTSYVGLACNAIPDDLTGQVALISRGSCNFSLKILNAQDAGAVGVVVFNNAAGAAPIVMGGDGTGITIPAVMIGNYDGVALVAGLTPSTVLTLDPSHFLPTPDQIATFSSSGPRFGDSAIKPDITAPGVDIYSAAMGTGTEAVSFQGTSMASPHVAGAAALLKQAHPSWSVQQIKSLLMNTATDESVDGVPYSVTQMGAGRVQVDVALQTSSVVAPASVSFGVQQSSHFGKETFSQKLTVQNLGTTTKTFSISSDFLFADDNDGSVSLYAPTQVIVKPGRSASFTFKLSVNFAQLAPSGVLGQYEGFVTLTQKGGSETLRVPFLIIPSARSDAGVSFGSYVNYLFSSSTTLDVANRGISGTTVDVYQFGVYDKNEALIPHVAGEPRQPDNWFDIQYTGVHLLDFGTLQYLEFAVTTYGNRNVADSMMTDIYVDVNHDGVPDYDVFSIEYGLFFGTGSPDGNMVSGIQELTTGDTYLEYFIGNDPNTALQLVGVDFGDINLLSSWYGLPQIDDSNPTFDYFVVTTDVNTGASDQTDSATFNLSPIVDTAPNYFYVDSKGSATVDVLGTGGSLLFLYYNNVSGYKQAQVVPVFKLQFHHGGH